MSFFSKVKRAAARATGVAARATLAPTTAASRFVGKVAPRPIAAGFRKAINLTPPALVARQALALSRSPARARAAPIVRRRPALSLVKPGGFFGRVSNAITQPTAAPSSGQMVAPSVVRAAAAVTSPGSSGYDDEAGAYDEGADFDDGGGYEDEGSGYDGGQDDESEGLEGLGHIDYEAALSGGLGDWSDDLKSFGVSAGKAVASTALTTVANKLGAGNKLAVPPPPPPMSTATKIAIGAAVAIPVGYLLLRRRPA